MNIINKTFVLTVFSSFINSIPQPVIYVIPPLGYHNEKLFDLTDKKFNRDDSQLVFVKLREALEKKGYLLTTKKEYAAQAQYVLVLNIPRSKDRHRNKTPV